MILNYMYGVYATNNLTAATVACMFILKHSPVGYPNVFMIIFRTTLKSFNYTLLKKFNIVVSIFSTPTNALQFLVYFITYSESNMMTRFNLGYIIMSQ